MNYHISVEAQNDLIEIWEYTFKKWSQDQADIYFHLIMNKIVELSITPGIGKSFANIRKGYFGSLAKSHIVFYKLRDSGKIEIIRILHQRMDFEENLLN